MPTLPAELDAKQTALAARLADAGRVLVAFSGGVDSSYLAFAAHRALGAGALAVTAVSPSYPESHRRIAEEVVARFGPKTAATAEPLVEAVEQTLGN